MQWGQGGLVMCGSTAVVLGLLLKMSGLLLQDEAWDFLQNSSGEILMVRELTPNVGLWWYFFTELFDRFRLFFIVIFHAHIALYVGPLNIRFKNEPFFCNYHRPQLDFGVQVISDGRRHGVQLLALFHNLSGTVRLSQETVSDGGCVSHGLPPRRLQLVPMDLPRVRQRQLRVFPDDLVCLGGSELLERLRGGHAKAPG